MTWLPCVEAGQITFTVALRVIRGDEKGTQYPVYNWAHPVPGVNKYGNLVLKVWTVSNETVKYGHEFCGT
jgi:hypothetical protein